MTDRPEDDVPPVTAGSVVLVQLREAGHYTVEDGAEVFHPQRAVPQLMTVHTREQCGTEPDPNIAADEFPAEPHQLTVCTECISQWARDYYVTLLDTPGSLGLPGEPTPRKDPA